MSSATPHATLHDSRHATLRATLRAATARHHARTESLVPVLDPALDLFGYAAILLRFRAAYAPLEHALAQVQGWPQGFDPAARFRTPLLDRDLAWLRDRAVLSDESFAVATDRHAHRAVPTLAHAMGTQYVLEGASLGGQVIVRRLSPRLGVTEGAGASFYTGAGAATGERWREFATVLDAWGEEHRDAWDEVVGGARKTFDAIASEFVARADAAMPRSKAG